MNKTSRAWIAVLFLLGLLLGSCEPAGAGDGTRAPGNTGQGATDFKTLPAECLEVNVDGEITAFDETKVDCDLKEFTIPAKKGSIVITAIGTDSFRNNALTKLSIPNSVKTVGTSAFDNNWLTELSIPNSVKTIGENAFSGNSKLETVFLDPHASLSFFASSFPGDLLTPFNGQRPKKAGTWVRDRTQPWTIHYIWSFRAH